MYDSKVWAAVIVAVAVIAVTASADDWERRLAIQKYRQTYGVDPQESWVQEFLSRSWMDTQGTVPGRAATVFKPYRPLAEPAEPLASEPATAQSQSSVLSGPSPCGRIGGDSQDDVFHVRYFCSQVIGKDELDEFVIGAYADGPILRLNVTQVVAVTMLRDRAATEAAVLRWMSWWKGLSGEQAVVVRVLLNDRTIARGRTTALSGDQVTIDQ